MATAYDSNAPGLEDRFWRFLSRRNVTSALALGIVFLAVICGTFTYMYLTGLTPFAPTRSLVIALLISNLVIVLIMFGMICWRVLRVVLARVSGTAGAKLHARLVLTFSVLAVLPAIIVALFASLTLNRGLDIWFGERTKLIIANAETVAEAYLAEHRHVLRGDILAMANDLNRAEQLMKKNPQRFRQYLGGQAAIRSLPAAFVIDHEGRILARATASFAPSISLPSQAQFAAAASGEPVVFTVEDGNQIRALVKLEAFPDAYLYVARFVDARVLEHLGQTRAAVSEYEELEKRRVVVQVTFALVYLAVTLIVLMAAIWAGLWVANRIVSPIGKLASASAKVSGGDLSARVPEGKSGDEIDMLGRAFNHMTSQLESQRQELVNANVKLDERRKFTEAVLAGVSAGVLGLDEEGVISHANKAAQRFFDMSEEEMLGTPIDTLMPALNSTIAQARLGTRSLVQDELVVNRNNEERTLAIRVAPEQGERGRNGLVLTFDDISELVVAQRTSAWADIARRIAHEIKNPLTPIQLSAERLKRKYRNEVKSDPEVFEQCTDTIVRQVSDIGRMVDEFSAFARMPTVMIRPTDLSEIARQAVFLQRVGEGSIRYSLRVPKEPVTVECDGRLMNQALTNVLKNAAEAVHAAPEKIENNETNGETIGRIDVAVEERGDEIAVVVTDTGCGLPEADRLKLVEPYMTTRAKGTGLGLAIVNKIMDEHGGSLLLDDAPKTNDWPHGARVTLILPKVRSEERNDRTNFAEAET